MINNLFSELERLLRPVSTFCTEDGVLIKSNIIESALRLDPELLRLLLGNDRLRENFFTTVDGTMVFDKVKFMRFVICLSYIFFLKLFTNINMENNSKLILVY